MRRYGMTPGDYARLYARQGGACALCGKRPGKGKRLHVDHDHDTGRVRGLLCISCNRSIAVLGDDAPGLFRAYVYTAQVPLSE